MAVNDAALQQSVKNIEEAMRSLGINPGKVDGVVDADFKRAVTEGFSQAAVLTGGQLGAQSITPEGIDAFKASAQKFLQSEEYTTLKKIQTGNFNVVSDPSLVPLKTIPDPAARMLMGLQIKAMINPSIKATLEAMPESMKNNLPAVLAVVENSAALAEDVRKVHTAGLFGDRPQQVASAPAAASVPQPTTAAAPAAAVAPASAAATTASLPVDAIKNVRAWEALRGIRPGEGLVGQLMGWEPDNSKEVLKHILDISTRIVRDHMNGMEDYHYQNPYAPAPPQKETANVYSREFMERARAAVATDPKVKAAIESRLPPGVKSAEELFTNIEAIDVYLNGPLPARAADLAAQQSTTGQPAASTEAPPAPQDSPATTPSTTQGIRPGDDPSIFVIETALHKLYNAIDEGGEKLIPNMPAPGAVGGEFDTASRASLYHAISMIKADLVMRGVYPLGKDENIDGQYVPGKTDELIRMAVQKLPEEERKKYMDRLSGDAGMDILFSSLNDLSEKKLINNNVAATFTVNQQALAMKQAGEGFKKFLPAGFLQGIVDWLSGTGWGQMLGTLLKQFFGIDLFEMVGMAGGISDRDRLINGYNAALAEVGGDHSQMAGKLKENVDGIIMKVFTDKTQREIMKEKIDEAYAHAQEVDPSKRAEAFADYMLSQAGSVRAEADLHRAAQNEVRENAGMSPVPAQGADSTGTGGAAETRRRVEINFADIFNEARTRAGNADDLTAARKREVNAGLEAFYQKAGLNLTEEQKAAMRSLAEDSVDKANAGASAFMTRTFINEMKKGLVDRKIDLGVDLVDVSPAPENERQAAGPGGRLGRDVYGRPTTQETTVRDIFQIGGGALNVRPVDAGLAAQASEAEQIYADGVTRGRIKQGMPMVYDLGDGRAILTRPVAGGGFEHRQMTLPEPYFYPGLDGGLNVEFSNIALAGRGRDGNIIRNANGDIQIDTIGKMLHEQNRQYLGGGQAGMSQAIRQQQAYEDARHQARQGWVNERGQIVQGDYSTVRRAGNPGNQPFNPAQYAADFQRYVSGPNAYNDKTFYIADEVSRNTRGVLGGIFYRNGLDSGLGRAVADDLSRGMVYAARGVAPVSSTFNGRVFGVTPFGENAADMGGIYVRSPQQNLPGFIANSRTLSGLKVLGFQELDRRMGDNEIWRLWGRNEADDLAYKGIGGGFLGTVLGR